MTRLLQFKKKNFFSDPNPHFSFFGQESESVVQSCCGSCPSSSPFPACSSLIQVSDGAVNPGFCQPCFRSQQCPSKDLCTLTPVLVFWAVSVRLFSPIVHLPGPVVAFCVKFRGKLNYCIKIRGCGIYKTVSLHPRCWLVPPLQVGACFGPFSRLFFLCALCPICQSTSPLLQVLGDS